MCRTRMCNNFIVEGSYKKDPLINPSVTANASHVRHNDFQRPNRIFASQIFDDLKLLPLPVTNSFCEPLPFTRYPFFSRATSASSFAIRSCNWPISSNGLLVCSAAYRLPHRSRCDARPASPCSTYSFIQRSNILKLSPCSFAKPDSHHPNISPVISGYKQPSKSAQSIEITGFIEKSKPPEIIFFYTLLPLTA